MIKLKSKLGRYIYLNVLNIVSVEQENNGYVRIERTCGKYTETTEEFDVVVKKIEKMLIRIAGGERVQNPNQ